MLASRKGHAEPLRNLASKLQIVRRVAEALMNQEEGLRERELNALLLAKKAWQSNDWKERLETKLGELESSKEGAKYRGAHPEGEHSRNGCLGI